MRAYISVGMFKGNGSDGFKNEGMIFLKTLKTEEHFVQMKVNFIEH